MPNADTPAEHQEYQTERGLRFATTSWTDVVAARQGGSPAAAAAMEKFCTTYWYPVYAYLRRRGCDPHQAQDLTQEFFYRLVKTDLLGSVDRQKGKFRSFLLVVVRRFHNDERDRGRALKRGGGQAILSLDAEDAEGRYALEPSSDQSPDKAYEQAWFRTLLAQVLNRLREESVAAGKGVIFDRLKVFLDDDSRPGVYQAVAAELGMKPNAVAVAVFRLKQRYQELTREEIARTVSDPAHIESELRHLLALFG
jgi:RNA polymerase sigma-70 factor (ECF subfamily)